MFCIRSTEILSSVANELRARVYLRICMFNFVVLGSFVSSVVFFYFTLNKRNVNIIHIKHRVSNIPLIGRSLFKTI